MYMIYAILVLLQDPDITPSLSVLSYVSYLLFQVTFIFIFLADEGFVRSINNSQSSEHHENLRREEGCS